MVRNPWGARYSPPGLRAVMQCSTLELVSSGFVANSQVEGYLGRGSITAPVEAFLAFLGLTSIASSYRAESEVAMSNSVSV